MPCFFMLSCFHQAAWMLVERGGGSARRYNALLLVMPHTSYMDEGVGLMTAHCHDKFVSK